MEYLLQEPKGVEMDTNATTSERKMTVATVFTLARIPLAILGILVFNNHRPILGMVIIVLAALTDFLDGQVARRFNCVTEFGRRLDPTADKIFILIVLAFAFAKVSAIEGVAVLMSIVAIEVILALLTFTSIRTYHQTLTVVTAGKWGMFGRMVSVGSLLTATALSGSLHQAFLILGVTSGVAGVILGFIATYAYARQMDAM